MNTRQQGFTLIELVVVIVILGILAATALPKFVDLSTEARTAARQGVAGGMGSAMAINYAGCAAVNNAPAANKCIAVSDCSATGSLMQGGMPTGYTVAAAAIGAGNGTTTTCTMTQTDGGATQTFSGIRAGT